jgi:hypothetical protein
MFDLDIYATGFAVALALALGGWLASLAMQIRARTDDTGKAYRVEGQREPQALSLKVNGDTKDLPRYVSTFAYWDRDFLKQRRLLNPQTGL